VHYVDLSEAQAAMVTASDESAEAKLASISTGTATDLSFGDRSFDVVLNMGPMYHLAPAERPMALSEMRRVLRDDGLLVCAYISRFAALMDGYRKGWISDPVYNSLAVADIESGTHDSPDDDKYFTLAYMHRPEEIAPELASAGFGTLALYAVEGFFWTYPHLGQFEENPQTWRQLLAHAERLETEPSLLGASAHMLAMAAKSQEKAAAPKRRAR
jgi:SAM-dependent methyltransferase